MRIWEYLKGRFSLRTTLHGKVAFDWPGSSWKLLIAWLTQKIVNAQAINALQNKAIIMQITSV